MRKKLFTSKNTKFKQDDFLDEVKLFYTRMINRWITDEKDRLTVFDRNGPYLATKRLEKIIQRLNRLNRIINSEWTGIGRLTGQS